MSRRTKRLAHVLMIVLPALAGGGCAAFDVVQSLSPTYQPISGPVEIGGEWVEITPPAPLKSVQVRQQIQLKVPGVETWENDYKTVRYQDGRSGRIEAFLFDDKGDSYELAIYGTGGVGGGVNLSRKRTARQPDQPPTLEPDYPRDRNYTRLRIRSDVPIRGDEIVWVCSTPK